MEILEEQKEKELREFEELMNEIYGAKGYSHSKSLELVYELGYKHGLEQLSNNEK